MRGSASKRVNAVLPRVRVWILATGSLMLRAEACIGASFLWAAGRLSQQQGSNVLTDQLEEISHSPCQNLGSVNPAGFCTPEFLILDLSLVMSIPKAKELVVSAGSNPWPGQESCICEVHVLGILITGS